MNSNIVSIAICVLLVLPHDRATAGVQASGDGLTSVNCQSERQSGVQPAQCADPSDYCDQKSYDHYLRALRYEEKLHYIAADREYQEAGKGKCVDAIFRRGLLFYGGKIGREKRDGLKLILEAADKGHITAEVFGGAILLGDHASNEDVQRGVKYFQQATDSGSSEGMVGLANIYASGIDVKPDGEKAEKLLLKVIEKNDSQRIPATYLIGVMYMDGIAVKVDNEKALKWLQIAADAKYSDAQNRIEQIALRSRQ